MHPQGGSRERGASLVEFALLLPVFTMLIFGMITAGLALNEKQQMTHATREGARYAATVPPDQDVDLDGDGTPNEAGETWAQAVRDLIIERSTGTLTASDDICVSLVKGNKPTTAITTPKNTSPSHFSTATGGAACIADQSYSVVAGDEGLRVQVTASKPATIDLIMFGVVTVTIDAEATAHSESN